MLRNIGLLLILIIGFSGFIFMYTNVLTLTVYAQSAAPIWGKANENSVQQLPGPNNEDVATNLNDSYAVQELVPYVIKILMLVSAAAALIFLISAGWQYLLGDGEEGTYTQAKKTIIWSIIGLVLSVFSYAIVDVIANIEWFN